MEEISNAVAKISRVASITKKKKLTNLNAVEEETSVLKKYLGVSATAVVLFAAISDWACSQDKTDLADLADYFSCSTLDILSHKHELDELVSARLVLSGKSNVIDYSTLPSKSTRMHLTAFWTILR